MMRLALLITVATVAGLGACAPVGPYGYSSYGYTAVQPAPAVPYGYYDGGYAAPAPYYAEPAYGAPYVAPGPTIIVGGGGRPYERDRYGYDRPRNEGGYRGNPNLPPNRENGGRPGPQNYSGGRPGPQNFGGGGGRPNPTPAAINRPGPSGGQPEPRPQLSDPSGFNPANPGAHGGADR